MTKVHYIRYHFDSVLYHNLIISKLYNQLSKHEFTGPQIKFIERTQKCLCSQVLYGEFKMKLNKSFKKTVKLQKRMSFSWFIFAIYNSSDRKSSLDFLVRKINLSHVKLLLLRYIFKHKGIAISVLADGLEGLGPVCTCPLKRLPRSR